MKDIGKKAGVALGLTAIVHYGGYVVLEPLKEPPVETPPSAALSSLSASTSAADWTVTDPTSDAEIAIAFPTVGPLKQSS
jgi:hypothetical protein